VCRARPNEQSGTTGRTRARRHRERRPAIGRRFPPRQPATSDAQPTAPLDGEQACWLRASALPFAANRDASCRNLPMVFDEAYR